MSGRGAHAGAPVRLVRVAALPLAASLMVLAIADVGPATWTLQLCAVALAAGVALAFRPGLGLPHAPARSVVLIAVALVGLGLSLLADGQDPHRWLPIGPVRLYLAPVVLPVLLMAWHALAHAPARLQAFANAAVVTAGVMFALQPDASQALALLSAVTVIGWRADGSRRAAVPVWIGLALAAAWAVRRPDPLQPVPHVEGVMALAFAHAVPAGLVVVAGAVALVAGLWRAGGTGASALQGLAAYYATLFLCAHAGLTPAPLIGVGAGPWLGYGLLAAMAPRAAHVRPR